MDSSDKKIQTNMMLKEKGTSTDQMVVEYSQDSLKMHAKSKIRSSLADTVTTALGGIPAQTEAITEYEIPSPQDMMKETQMTRNRMSHHLKARPQSSNLIANTYTYNIKGGIIEEEDDLLGLGNFSGRSKANQFQTVNSTKSNNFTSPGALRPTALQKHQKAYKSQYKRRIHDQDQQVVFDNFSSSQKESKRKDKSNDHMKSIYIHYGIGGYQNRPMTEQPGMRKDKSKNTVIKRGEISRPTTKTGGKSRPVSQDPTMSKTHTQGSMYARNYTRCKSSLRNLIKVASTRNTGA